MSRLEEEFPLEGGWLCLGFCNTVGWHSGAYRRAELYSTIDWEPVEGARERFTDYRSLLRWFLRKRQLTVSEAKALLRAARMRPEEAEAVRRRAVELRETLYHLFSALAADEPGGPDPRDVAALNEWLPEAMARRRLAYPGETDSDGFSDARRAVFAWKSSAPVDELERFLWPVVWSTVELLTAGPLERVRECDNDPCGWLFVDSSRNRSRRWCDMRDCGNRVKARRHYARTRGARAAS